MSASFNSLEIKHCSHAFTKENDGFGVARAEGSSSMNISMQHGPFGPRALFRPAVLPTRFAMIQLCSDAVAFVTAALCAGLVLGVDNDKLLLQALILTVWCLFVFNLLGLYRRSYAVLARDEFYFVAVATAFAFFPVLLTGISQEFRSLVPHLVLTMTFAIVLCGLTRVILFEPRQVTQEKESAIVFPIKHPVSATVLLKRITDIALGSFACIAFLPFMLVAAVALFMESGFPIFFRQERVGKDGRSFQIIKFRTMRPNASSHWARRGDDRITPLGSILRRFSIDEMPQIINVLRGDMSIVGPRPEWRTFADEFAVSLPHYNDRHFVNPGITGWAQIYMNRNLSPSDAPVVLLHDLFYVSHCSIFLDFCIILKTAVEFLFHRAV